jgi:TatD DNase family protein
MRRTGFWRKSVAVLCDTHAHLCDPVFDADRSEVLSRAVAAGVCSVITVSENLRDAQRNLQLASEHPQLKPAAGLYPTHLDVSEAEEIIGFIRRERGRLFAIGEVGLDFWKVQQESARSLQRQIFTRFIDLARELDLPLNIHSRSAGRHVIALLLQKEACRVHLHAFDGRAASALPAVEAGYFFSIPPSVVRSHQKQNLVRSLPLSCLLVETDSPVLGPSSGERNEPSNALICVDAIAEIKGVSRQEALETIEQNTIRLYGRSIL